MIVIETVIYYVLIRFNAKENEYVSVSRHENLEFYGMLHGKNGMSRMHTGLIWLGDVD
jgi:hypothetical protein